MLKLSSVISPGGIQRKVGAGLVPALLSLLIYRRLGSPEPTYLEAYMNLERDQEMEIPQMNAENHAATSRGVIQANITGSEWALLLAREQAARAEVEAAMKR